MKITCNCGHEFEYSESEVFSHKVLCGDSTSVTDIEKLMGDEKVDMVFTSPPYTDQRTYKIGKFDWNELMNGVFASILSIVKETTHILVNLGLSHKSRKVDFYWNKWLEYMADAGYPLFGWYVWDKGSGMPGKYNGRLSSSFEFIFHFNKRSDSANKWVETSGESQKRDHSNKTFRQSDGSLKRADSSSRFNQKFKIPDSVIRITRASGNITGHPAVYPVALPEFGCKTWTKEKDIVYEPFAGSGTTLIACDKTKRRCRAIEIAETYVDIIVARFARFTGNKGMRLNGKKYEWGVSDEN